MSAKYGIIYADPPWRYSFSRSDSRQIENQYPTMSAEEICALSVPAAEDCVLFLWATAPKLVDALRVMAAWGFEYKTHLVWDKQILGMGYWFRGQHELLLVGVKGHVSPPAPSDRISSVFGCRRGKHSHKPDRIREWVVRAFPDAARVELFAREKADGFDAWGNEVECDLELAGAQSPLVLT